MKNRYTERKLTRKGWTNVSIRKTLHSDLISRAAYRKLSIGSYIQKLVDLDKKMEQFDALTTEDIVNDMEKYLDMIVKLQEEDYG